MSCFLLDDDEILSCDRDANFVVKDDTESMLLKLLNLVTMHTKCIIIIVSLLIVLIL